MWRFAAILLFATMFQVVGVCYSTDAAPSAKTDLYDNDVGVDYLDHVCSEPSIPNTVFVLMVEDGWINTTITPSREISPIQPEPLNIDTDQPDRGNKRRDTNTDTLNPGWEEVQEVNKTLNLIISPLAPNSRHLGTGSEVHAAGVG